MSRGEFIHHVDTFLRLLERGRSIADAAQELGFHRQTAYDWRDANPTNSTKIDEAKSKFRAKLVESLLGCIEGDELKDREPDGALALKALQVIGGDDWRPKQEIAHSLKPTIVDYFKSKEHGTPQGSGSIPE